MPAASAAMSPAAPATPPAAVWAELLTGNARFVLGTPTSRDLTALRGELTRAQSPRAIVLACSDSRVPPELVFDQSLGDLFVVRTAGEAVDAMAVASIEYAVDHLGARLIVVLGHEKCGAVTAALSGEPMPTPALAELVARLEPAIASARTSASPNDALARAIDANVAQSASALLASSAVLREKLASHQLMVVEALYSLSGGEVRELARRWEEGSAPAMHSTPPTMSAPRPTPAADTAPPLPDVSPEAKPAMRNPPSSAAPSAPKSSASSTTPARASGPTSPISWEASMRFRYEARSVLDYRLPGTFKRPATQRLSESGDQSLMRTRIGASLRLAPGVRGNITLQDARLMGAEGSPGGMIANVDLFQAYADLDSLGPSALTLRAGRQIFQYGDGRVVGGSEWSNSGRAWDGLRLRFAPPRWQADALVAWVNEGRLTGGDRVLAGTNTQWKPRAGAEVEAYLFLRSFGDATAISTSGTTGRLHDGTTGLRLRTTPGRFDFRLEAATQQGRRAAEDVHAWFGAARGAYEIPSRWKPRLQLEWLTASGDSSPRDKKSQRYDPVYWSGHGYLGQLDVVGCANVRDLNLVLGAQPARGASGSIEVHRFRLNEARDVWVDDSGNILRRSSDGSAGTDLGTEMDLGFKWDLRPRVGLSGGWSRFWKGDFVRQTGGGKDLEWGYLQLALSM
ncbi:MAG: alginate export family protein [Candidatus Eisenbacteria bacterium]